MTGDVAGPPRRGGIWARLRAGIAALGRDRGGATAALTAVLLTALLGFTGLAVDVGWWEGSKRSAQGAADQAALAAAIVTPCAANNTNCYVTAARAIAGQQGFVNGSTVNGGPIAVKVYYPMSNDTTNCPGDPHCSDPNAIEVVVTEPQPRIFSGLFLYSVSVAARAVVDKSLFPTCMLALDTKPMDNHTIFLNSGANVDLNNCSIADNTPPNGTGASNDSIDVKEMGSVATLKVSGIIQARDSVCDGNFTGDNVGNCNGDFYFVDGSGNVVQSCSHNTPCYSPQVLTRRTTPNAYASTTFPTPSETNGNCSAANTNVVITTSQTLSQGTYCGTNGNAALTISGSPSTVTISKAVNNSGAPPPPCHGVASGDAIEFFTGVSLNTTSNGGSKTLNFTSTTGVTTNMAVSDITHSGGIPSGTMVTAVTSTSVTLSQTTTGGAMGVASGDLIAFMSGSATTLDTSAATTSGTTLTFSGGVGSVTDGMAVVDTTTANVCAISAGTTVTNVNNATPPTVTLNPGVYILDGQGGSTAGNTCPLAASRQTQCSGDLVVTNGAIVNGTGGVTIVLTTSKNNGNDVGNIYVDSSGSQLNLTAPTTGATAGIAIEQNPCTSCTPATPNPAQVPYNNNTAGQNFIGTGSSANITGVLYFPNQGVVYSGATQNNTNPSCTQIVAWAILFVNNTTFTYGSTCSTTAGVQTIAGVPVLAE